MENNIKSISLGAGLVLLTLLVVKYGGSESLGGASPGTQTGTTTIERTMAVTGTASTIFETRPNCAARIIQTGSTTIMFSTGSTTPIAANAFLGIFQAASTTGVYDSEIYGCGNWRAIGLNQVGAISVIEYR